MKKAPDTNVPVSIRFICLAAALLATGSSLSRAQVPAAERAALEALYNSTSGASWTNSANWMSESPVGTWYGVTVQNIDGTDRVVVIDLEINNLNGPLPAEWADLIGNQGALSRLDTLDLTTNQLSGQIPDFLGNLAQLRFLDLARNNLTGAIPPALTGLTNLRELHLWANGLTGTIPDLSGLALLEVIGLGANLLTGGIADWVGTLGNLTILDVNNNELGGTIPADLSRLSKLTWFDISSNKFTGAIPIGFTDLAGLNDFRIDDNELTDLPDFGHFEAFTRFWVNDNRFTFEDLEPNAFLSGFVGGPQKTFGTASTQVVEPGGTTTLSFVVGGSSNFYQWYKDGNALTEENASSYTIFSASTGDAGSYTLEATNESVPGVTLFSEVITVLLSEVPVKERDALVALYNSTNGPGWSNNTNWLTGPVSTWYGVHVTDDPEAGGSVTDLDLGANNLSGMLPAELGDLSNLVSLDLAGNQITGTIPTAFGLLTSLDFLSLSANQLAGDIPAGFANFHNLRTLDIANNQLSGLPDLSNLEVIETIQAGNNRFTFEDIEPNVGGPSVLFVYAPQALIGSPENVSVMAGETLFLSIPTPGSFNVYQWFKDGSEIVGATGASYIVPSTTSNDAGSYALRVRNSLAADLTLVSHPTDVVITDYPTVTVTRPSGGEVLAPGGATEIRWTSTDLTGSLRIELWRGGTMERLVAGTTTNDGLHVWSVPEDLPIDNRYRIRIYSLSFPDAWDESDADFAIGLAQLVVVRPNGGEVWAPGTSQRVEWSSSNVGGTVRLELLRDGAFEREIAATTANDGVFDWAIPGDLLPGGGYSVRVSDLNSPSIADESDATFSIGNVAITVVSPNGGESWVPGSLESVLWTSMNVEGSVRIELMLGGESVLTIASATANDGEYDWTIAGDAAQDSEYRIRITSVDFPVTFDESDASFALRSPQPVLSVSPLTLTFSGTEVGAGTVRDIEVSNVGDGVLEFSISVTGDSDQVFGHDVTSASLLAGETRVVEVGFYPLDESPHSATLVLDSNVGSESVALSGTGTRPDIEPASPTPVGPGADLPLEVELSPTFNPQIRQICYRRIGESDSDFVCSALAFAGTLNTTALPAAYLSARGVEYYFSFSLGNYSVTEPAGGMADPLVYRVPWFGPSSPIVVVGRTYRMISVPLADVTSVVPESGAVGDRRLLRYNPGREAYDDFSVDPSLSAEADFMPGKAYWYITEDGSGIEVNGGTSVDPGVHGTISLPPGWSQIGNPYAFPVAWASVDRSADVTTPVAYDASVDASDPYRYEVTVLEPWNGYFVFNGGEATTITVRPEEAALGSSESYASLERLAGRASYVLQLTAFMPSRGVRDSQNYLGLADDATEGFDRLDFAEAPGVGSHVRLSIVGDHARMAGSFKALNTEGREWRSEISAQLPGQNSGEGETVHVLLANVGELPNGFDVYVFDDDAGERLPIVESAFDVRLTRDRPVRRVRIIVGTKKYATEQTDDRLLVPQRFTLYQNYPNPFNPTTRIRYQLSESAPVRLEIYNTLGQRISTLVNRELEPGWYEATWSGRSDDGSPAASGLYFYRLTAGSGSQTKSMVLLQ